MLAASSCLLSVRPRAHTHTQKERENQLFELLKRGIGRRKKLSLTICIYHVFSFSVEWIAISVARGQKPLLVWIEGWGEGVKLNYFM